MTSDATNQSETSRFDAVVIGAGMSGMYLLHRLRQLGMNVRAYEAASDVGGTWYWNRYPGARFDSESYSYSFSFSPELLQEWTWSEHFAAQPETLRYLNLVADKFDLRRDIQFNTRVTAARFDERTSRWSVTLDDGSQASAKFLITAVGVLSTPVLPSYPGRETFGGESYHPGLWPHEPVSFAGKRVAVIGTGSTGVQIIQEVAKTAESLTVFQRNPNWCAPLHNRPMSTAEQQQLKDTAYRDIFARCAESPGGFLYKADPRSTFEVSDAEREAFYETLYNEPGFGIWLSTFRDVLLSQEANDTLVAFIARKIRQRVKDQRVAEKLIPKDHGFGTRRVALETKYFEVYNQDNVELVDLNEENIVEVTQEGIRTSAKPRPFDMIVYATGFDAVLGSLNKIDIHGVGDRVLKAQWDEKLETFLGLMTPGFPNFFTIVGPQSAGVLCNFPRCIEQNVDWTAALLAHVQGKGVERVEVTAEAARDWARQVDDMSAKLLMGKTNSWFTGVNKNLAGRDKRIPLIYAGGAPRYREICDRVAAGGYKEFKFD